MMSQTQPDLLCFLKICFLVWTTKFEMTGDTRFYICTLSTGFKDSFVRHCFRETEVSKTVLSVGSKTAFWRSQNKRMDYSLPFFTRYHPEGDEFLDHIVTKDDPWVSHVTPESK